jgi:chemotaxis protein histidine kinase CheA
MEAPFPSAMEANDSWSLDRAHKGKGGQFLFSTPLSQETPNLLESLTQLLDTSHVGGPSPLSDPPSPDVSCTCTEDLNRPLLDAMEKSPLPELTNSLDASFAPAPSHEEEAEKFKRQALADGEEANKQKAEALADAKAAKKKLKRHNLADAKAAKKKRKSQAHPDEKEANKLKRQAPPDAKAAKEKRNRQGQADKEKASKRKAQGLSVEVSLHISIHMNITYCRIIISYRLNDYG